MFGPCAYGPKKQIVPLSLKAPSSSSFKMILKGYNLKFLPSHDIFHKTKEMANPFIHYFFFL